MNQMPRSLVHVVDDNSAIRDLMAALMNKFGYDVLSFPDAQSYLEYLNSDQFVEPLVTFVDVIMPNMNGYEMIAAIAPEHQGMKFIIMSAESDIRSEYKHLACMFLKKPFHIESIEEVLSQMEACRVCGPSNDLDCDAVDQRAYYQLSDWSCPNATDIQLVPSAEPLLNKRLSDYLHY